MKYTTEHSNEHPYTMISNATIDDKNLSPASLGVLVKALRYKDDSNFSIKGMQNSWGKCKGIIKTAIRLLEKLGYVIAKKQSHLPNGDWNKDTLDFYETPMLNIACRQKEQPLKCQSQTNKQLNKSISNTNTLNTISYINHSRDKIERDFLKQINFEELEKQCNNIVKINLLNEIVDVAVGTLCNPKEKYYIRKTEFIKSVVISQFKKLTQEHILRVIDILTKNQPKTPDYIISCLYDTSLNLGVRSWQEE